MIVNCLLDEAPPCPISDVEYLYLSTRKLFFYLESVSNLFQI